MISTYFVTNLAFCIGALSAFWPLYKKIKQFLSSTSSKVEQEITLPYDIQKRSKELLNSAIIQNRETEEAIAEVLKKAQEEYNLIIASNKNDIENIIEKHLDIAVQRISGQISTVVQSLKLNTVDIATSAIQELIKEYNDHQKQDNSGVLSTLDRDLRKKLH